MTNTVTSGAVIAAVDGSVDARRAVDWAAHQARLEHRPLTLVHASPGNGSGARRSGRPDSGRLADSLRSSHLLLEEARALAAELQPGVPIAALSLPGAPLAALVEISRDAHLLVMGSRGRGRVTSRLLGSVSADVTKQSACPVVVVRPTVAGAVKDGVLVGADGTAESRPVIEFAFRQASLNQLPLTVVHCVYDEVAAVLGVRGGPADDRPDAEDLQMILAESVAGLAEKYPDVPVRKRLTRGLVEQCLMVGQRPWNLVVVGRHPVDRFHPSTSTAVLERSASVVAIVPETPAAR